jgi:hypothetical protein
MKGVKINITLCWELIVLQIIFIICKVANGIHWGWKWVLVPLWIQLGIIGIYIILYLILLLIDYIIQIKEKKI